MSLGSLFSAWCNDHGWLGSKSHFPFYCMVIIVSVTIILRNIIINKNIIIVEYCLLFMTVLSSAHHLLLQIKVFLIPEQYTCHVFCSMLPSSSTYRNTFIISMNVAIVFIRHVIMIMIFWSGATCNSARKRRRQWAGGVSGWLTTAVHSTSGAVGCTLTSRFT